MSLKSLMLSEEAYQAPGLSEMGEMYRGANICLVAQGPTGKRDFSQYGSENPDEPWHVWTQNGGWIVHTYSSLGFIMDDIKSPVWDNIKRFTRDEIEHEVRKARFPLITSRAYPEFPALVEFPLKQAMDVLPKVNKSINLNETINYMIALGIMWGVAKMDFWGVDYFNHEERAPIRPDKRACCEYWIGMAAMSGIQIRTYSGSDLMRYNLHHPDTEIEGVYGYEQANLPADVLDKLEIFGGGRAQIKVGV